MAYTAKMSESITLSVTTGYLFDKLGVTLDASIEEKRKTVLKIQETIQDRSLLQLVSFPMIGNLSDVVFEEHPDGKYTMEIIDDINDVLKIDKEKLMIVDIDMRDVVGFMIYKN